MSIVFDRIHRAPHEAPGVLHVEPITTVEEFRVLRDAWNALLAQSRADCVFLTWEWLFTWWKYFSPGRELAILAVRDGAELVALAPF
ncbi:MAG: glycosyl transferase family 1, partial [Candidatus Rokubacteria bacterium]|nr:glycosyl transferase family 1 [Candidatus Rokubacteria bacterium]